MHRKHQITMGTTMAPGIARAKRKPLQTGAVGHRPLHLHILSFIVMTILFPHLNSNFNLNIQQQQQVPTHQLISYAQAETQQEVRANSLQLSFIKSMDSLNVRENTPVDEVIYTLEAQTEQQPQGVRIAYNIEGTQLFSLAGDRMSGRVRVAQPIDREQTGDSITFQVTATPYFGNQPGTPTKLTVTVYVLDENDNPPQFERVQVARQTYDSQALTRSAAAAAAAATSHKYQSPGQLNSGPTTQTINKQSSPVIRLNVSEDAAPESVLVDSIEAIDLDKASASPLSAVCLGCEPEFKLVPRGAATALNDHLEWALLLAQPLVHVPGQNVRHLNVLVSDGKFNSSLVLELTIDDVQNQPPHFISSTTCVVQENTPIDKIVLTLQAVDGDALALESSGPIVVPQSVRATNGGGGHTATYGGRQIIYDFYDPSTGQSSSVRNDFRLHPLTGALQVANRLDREAYLAHAGVLSLRVRARELTVDAETVAVAGDDLHESILSKLTNFISTSEDSATETEVTIVITDVNDNPPRWLNASEMRAMNESPAWHAGLPRDLSDTGRNYLFQVRENSLPGSPLTPRSNGRQGGMFVYDLDAGENAEFQLTLEDPFNLFDVEPKRVTGGFSGVTLKLADRQAHHLPPSSSNRSSKPQSSSSGTVLDYENINERSYIIQLHAIETKTRERFSSKAQIQINVVDVNDNAPEFREPAYVANVHEDAPAGKLVRQIQASDRDELTKQLTYSLHGASAYLFDIDPHKGRVTVASCPITNQQSVPVPMSVRGGGGGGQRLAPKSSVAAVVNAGNAKPRPCLDYETQRQHHLMIEASDGELSSKVPLTIYVEDASDNGPVFTLPIVDVVIEEGTERLDSPIRVEATDVDQSSALSYSIVEGNFQGLFSINNLTGELQLTRAIRIAHDDLSSSGRYAFDPVQSASPPPPPMELATASAGSSQLNKMTLIVQASDGQHVANGTVRIDILDANDNAPQFSRANYERELAEGAASPGHPVLTVRAFDSDRGNNARVSYRLERGSHGQFEINATTGEISVARDARPFDATKRDHYTLEVVAYDHGLVSKSSSAQVVVRLVANGRRPPVFEPQVQRETVNENVLNNTPVHRMSVSEPLPPPLPQVSSELLSQPQVVGPATQAQAYTLMFEPGPIEGLDKHGQPVGELERLESMFSVSANTGEVIVNSGLDHDFAAYVNLTIYVSYKPLVASPASSSLQQQPPPVNSVLYDQITGANSTAEALQPQQPPVEEYTPRSVGYLLITVVDDNQNAPVFAAPWTLQQPELSYQMLEELPVGSQLAQLVASDVDSKISHYEIDPPNEYFALTSAQSGVLVNKKVIDYDTLMRQTFLLPGSGGRGQQAATGNNALAQLPNNNNIIQFNVIVYDSGVKQLSAKAIVSVEILPINDNECKFEQLVYEARVRENALPDTVVAQVRATDLDYGEAHSSLSYSLLGAERDLFAVDSRTGVVTVSRRGSVMLDHEALASPVISLTVVGRDDQQQQQQQQVAASTGGGANNKRSQASNGNTLAGRSCATTLRVHVDDVNDNPPLFAQKLYEVIAYDTDTTDVPLVKLIVHDEDSKHSTSGAVNNSTGSSTGAKQQQQQQSVNSFRILSGNFNESFNITSSGMIYITKPLSSQLDRPSIELRVQVRQQSSSGDGGGGLGGAMAAGGQMGQLLPNVPALFTDECLVRVHVMKINRHAPEWRLESLKNARVEESAKPGTLVTQLRCVDADYEPSAAAARHTAVSAGAVGHKMRPASHAQITGQQSSSSAATANQPSPIRYSIKENGTNVLETSEFRLDPVTRNLITRVELDREKQDFYQLIVACEDNGRPQSLESITPLYVSVLDVDDNKLEFLVGGKRTEPLAPRRSPIGVDDRTAQRSSLPVVSFLVEEHQSKGLQVGELRAVDRDLSSRDRPITYCIVEGNEFQEFALDQVTGVLYTNQTLDREKQAAYDLLVRAYNDDDDGGGGGRRAACGAEEPALDGNSTSGTSGRQIRANKFATGNDKSSLRVHIDVLDINDNAPVFRRPVFRAGAHQRALMNTLITQVAALDPDHGANGTLTYRISKVLMYKTNYNPSYSSSSSSSSSSLASGSGHHHHPQHETRQAQASKPIELIQSPFRVDQQGNIYTLQLLTQYQLMSMFVIHLEATEAAEPRRTATAKLEIYLYETNSQLKIRINLHPRLVETHRLEIESLLSNATKYNAIINRARSYQTGSGQMDQKLLIKQQQHGKQTDKQHTLDLTSNQVSTSAYQSGASGGGGGGEPQEPNFSNIHAIFVDNNFRLVNPQVVIEKFDLTSAQLLFAQQSLQLSGGGGSSDNARHLASSSDSLADDFGAGSTPLIDRIALASAVHSAELQSAGPSSLAGIDWLESPSVLFVCLASMLTLIGLIICITGCCCTSRIKDHIIKVAMDKLVKQQTLQAKINERVLAATNQAYASSALSGAGGVQQSVNTLQSVNGAAAAAAMNGHDFIMQQGGGFMSSFDATKGCANNNYENMSILQRAMDAGEFIDPNYTTLTHNGHLNLGAHYYDASELDDQEQQQQQQQQQHESKQHQTGGSVVSLSLGDEEDEEQEMMMMMTTEGCAGNNNHLDPTFLTNNGDLNQQQQQQGGQQVVRKSNQGGQQHTTTTSNGGVVSSHSRMRQQIPNKTFTNDPS